MKVWSICTVLKPSRPQKTPPHFISWKAKNFREQCVPGIPHSLTYVRVGFRIRVTRTMKDRKNPPIPTPSQLSVTNKACPSIKETQSFLFILSNSLGFLIRIHWCHRPKWCNNRSSSMKGGKGWCSCRLAQTSDRFRTGRGSYIKTDCLRNIRWWYLLHHRSYRKFPWNKTSCRWTWALPRIKGLRRAWTLPQWSWPIQTQTPLRRYGNSKALRVQRSPNWRTQTPKCKAQDWNCSRLLERSESRSHKRSKSRRSSTSRRRILTSWTRKSRTIWKSSWASRSIDTTRVNNTAYETWPMMETNVRSKMQGWVSPDRSTINSVLIFTLSI